MDLEKYGITENEINKYNHVYICHPSQLEYYKNIIEREVESMDDIIIYPEPYMEDHIMTYVNNKSLRRVFIIKYLLQRKGVQ